MYPSGGRQSILKAGLNSVLRWLLRAFYRQDLRSPQIKSHHVGGLTPHLCSLLPNSNWLHYIIFSMESESCNCPIPGSAQSQAGWSFEEPAPVKGVPVPGRGLEISGL